MSFSTAVDIIRLELNIKAPRSHKLGWTELTDRTPSYRIPKQIIQEEELLGAPTSTAENFEVKTDIMPNTDTEKEKEVWVNTVE